MKSSVKRLEYILKNKKIDIIELKKIIKQLEEEKEILKEQLFRINGTIR